MKIKDMKKEAEGLRKENKILNQQNAQKDQ